MRGINKPVRTMFSLKIRCPRCFNGSVSLDWIRILAFEGLLDR